LQTEMVLITNCKTIFDQESALKMKLARNLLSKVVQMNFQDLDPIDDDSEDLSSEEYTPSSDTHSSKSRSRRGSSGSKNSLKISSPKKRLSSTKMVQQIQQKINIFKKLAVK